ncbi:MULTISPECIES: dienelactone hydrolase family protein [unclassified Bacillus (in: firmicutes)]|uniref:dienelactone hydrolase family protein n=1 Tax=unclassified Bacillus (in: firmicutes) TaxID=185979 RepID=UPI000D03A57F|nr:MULTISPECIES: dienelactone hydrolase family protein [unclassified Bacillus (in: firmicutes)]PRR89272.1 dienelactone hydrolase [Bacillus sp. NMCN1]PRR97003.1 dienelactone hydrolase [Bacillus sp. NMCN6]
MHTSKQKPVMILIHEIYGINDHMKSMIYHFEKAGFEVYCPHLLGKAKYFPYVSENEAYGYFMNKVGFDESVKIVLNVAKELKTKNAEIDIFLIGFSVGATIAWRCSQYDQLFTGVIGFYGSRIRDFVDITPSCKTLLFFPDVEASFNPREIASVLEKKEKLCVTIVEGKHGFANPYSAAFHAESKNRCFQDIDDFIKMCL